MRVRVANPKDFGAGLIFAAAGGGALVLSQGYPWGVLARMGPGLFPALLGGLLLLIGVAVAARGVAVEAAGAGEIAWRPLLGIPAAVLAFALLVERAGLLVATLALVILAAAAGPLGRPHEIAAVYIVLSALALGVFVWGLGLPFRVVPL